MNTPWYDLVGAFACCSGGSSSSFRLSRLRAARQRVRANLCRHVAYARPAVCRTDRGNGHRRGADVLPALCGADVRHLMPANFLDGSLSPGVELILPCNPALYRGRPRPRPPVAVWTNRAIPKKPCGRARLSIRRSLRRAFKTQLKLNPVTMKNPVIFVVESAPRWCCCSSFATSRRGRHISSTVIDPASVPVQRSRRPRRSQAAMARAAESLRVKTDSTFGEPRVSESGRIEPVSSEASRGRRCDLRAPEIPSRRRRGLPRAGDGRRGRDHRERAGHPGASPAVPQRRHRRHARAVDRSIASRSNPGETFRRADRVRRGR